MCNTFTGQPRCNWNSNRAPSSWVESPKSSWPFLLPCVCLPLCPPPPSPLSSAPDLSPREHLSPALSTDPCFWPLSLHGGYHPPGYSPFPVSSVSASLRTPLTGPSGSSSAVNFTLGNPFPSSSHVELNFSSDRTKSLQAVFNDSCCFSHEEGSGSLLPIMTSRLHTRQCIMEMK